MAGMLPYIPVDPHKQSLKPGAIVYYHEMSLDGDEELHIGGRVKLDPGLGEGSCVLAVTVEHDGETGFWYFLAISPNATA